MPEDYGGVSDFVTYRSLVANAPTTMAFGFHDIWRPPTRYIDTRKRAKSVMISIAPMASQRVDYTGRTVSLE